MTPANHKQHPSDLHVTRVRAYYERNTQIFLASGTDGQTRTIHRAVWAPGVTTEREALTYINQCVVRSIAANTARCRATPVRVLDVGCGVGGMLCHLVRHSPVTVSGVGVSISPGQVKAARRYASAQGLGERCTFLEGNYLALPFRETFDVAVAIESLVHAPDLARAFREAALVLRPGGRLIICDDTLQVEATAETAHPQAPLLAAAFRRGWYAPALATLETIVSYAEHAGLTLIEQCDLTPDLRLLQLPELVVDALLRVGIRLPADWAFTQSLVGGLALQHGLRHGVFRYRWLVFEKRA
jgi:ubiquinone/menaquinone biosynthesis C-methylase UbiE